MNTNYLLSEETFRLLEAQDWEEVVFKVQVAISKVLGIDLDSDVLPQGTQAHDLVYDAILSIYTGARHWDHQEEPNISVFIFNSVVRSNFSHLLESAGTRRMSRLDEKESSSDEELSTISSQEPTYSVEECIAFDDITAKVKQALGADKMAKEVFDLRLDGCTDSTVAYLLTLTIGQVRAANRRIKQLGNVLFPKKIKS